jgi:hypothetical protein
MQHGVISGILKIERRKSNRIFAIVVVVVAVE